MPDSPLSPDSTPQIRQDVKGDRNQAIGQVLGGMVVYGQVIYNTPVELAGADAKPDRTQIGPNPYRGLLAFQETDGDRFFGQDSQIQNLWEKFRGLHEGESATRLLAIYGPSGSGKSSLARAGLIPELARRPLPGRDRARVVVMVPGRLPLESLATVLARIATGDATPVAKIREFEAELKEVNSQGTYDGLRRIADALPEIEIKPLIVLVDQLEEVFTLCKDGAERDAFLGNLLCAAAERSKRVFVILTIRSDFLGATQQYPRLNQLIASQGFLVAAMSTQGLAEAIAKPAKMAGHPLDASIVDRLIEQTEGREGALPLLQFALTRIWAGLSEGQEPTETLRAIGGVGGALAGEAQRIYEGLSPEDREIARWVFLGLVQLGEGAKDTRRRTELERVISHRDSLEQVQKVIARFAAPGARLITLADDGGIQTAEVTHEALFDHWQQLKDWLDESRSDLRFQRRLDEAAMVWQANGRPEGNLWRSPDLDLLQQFHERSNDDMTPLQVSFFRASVAAEKLRVAAEENRVQTEKELLKTKLKVATQQRRLFGVIGIGTTVASLLTTYQLQQFERQRVEQLAANAQALLASRPVDATINAIAAMGLSQSAFVQFPDQPHFVSAQGSLLDVIRENPERNQLLHEYSVASVSFSPDGKRIVSGSWDGTMRVWDTNTGTPIGKPFQGHEGGITSVAFSPDGKQIVSGSEGGAVRLWDANTGAPIGNPLRGATISVISVMFSPDGKRIVSGNLDGTVWVWDASTGTLIGKPFQGDGRTVLSVSLSPDGKQIVSGSQDNTVRVWDASTGASIGKPFQGHENLVTSVAFSPDGKQIVSGSEDNKVRLWDANTGALIGKPFQGHESKVTSVSFSPDGKQIVSGSSDTTVRLWDANTGAPIGKPFQYKELVDSVSFSPDSKRIVSSGGNGTVRMWEVSWEEALHAACQQLRYHPSLNQPATDVAKAAKQTCEKYAWNWLSFSDE